MLGHLLHHFTLAPLEEVEGEEMHMKIRVFYTEWIDLKKGNENHE
jgi:hypothetical protein